MVVMHRDYIRLLCRISLFASHQGRRCDETEAALPFGSWAPDLGGLDEEFACVCKLVLHIFLGVRIEIGSQYTQWQICKQSTTFILGFHVYVTHNIACHAM